MRKKGFAADAEHDPGAAALNGWVETRPELRHDVTDPPTCFEVQRALEDCLVLIAEYFLVVLDDNN
jgi:hypothetical protein